MVALPEGQMETESPCPRPDDLNVRDDGGLLEDVGVGAVLGVWHRLAYYRLHVGELRGLVVLHDLGRAARVNVEQRRFNRRVQNAREVRFYRHVRVPWLGNSFGYVSAP